MPFFDDFVVISFRWMTISIDLNADSESAQKTASASVPYRASWELLFFVQKSPLVPPRVQPKGELTRKNTKPMRNGFNRVKICPGH